MKTFTALLAGAALTAFAAPALAQDADVQDAGAAAQAEVQAEGDAEAVSVTVGSSVSASDGSALGEVVALGSDTAGTEYVLIEGSDGQVRGVQSSLVSSSASGFSAELTSEAFLALPVQPPLPSAPAAGTAPTGTDTTTPAEETTTEAPATN